MIVLDSSVWIGHKRGLDSPEVLRLRRLVEAHDDQILIGDLILLEISRGSRDEAHAARIERGLRQFPIVPVSARRGSEAYPATG